MQFSAKKVIHQPSLSSRSRCTLSVLGSRESGPKPIHRDDRKNEGLERSGLWTGITEVVGRSHNIRDDMKRKTMNDEIDLKMI